MDEGDTKGTFGKLPQNWNDISRFIYILYIKRGLRYIYKRGLRWSKILKKIEKNGGPSGGGTSRFLKILIFEIERREVVE